MAVLWRNVFRRNVALLALKTVAELIYGKACSYIIPYDVIVYNVL
jgi:hypothetical protein